jgi:hypothetical protein
MMLLKMMLKWYSNISRAGWRCGELVLDLFLWGIFVSIFHLAWGLYIIKFFYFSSEPIFIFNFNDDGII